MNQHETELELLRERVRAAAAARTPLEIKAGGSKQFYGNAIHGELLDVSGYRGIVEYEPTELVITARCGTPLTELEAALAEQRQMLPFEAPQFGGDATIGGAVASGLAGPRRMSTGAPRDFVLGAKLLDGHAEVLSFGGNVMKNVAGYDVSRLLAGSLGTLGVLLEISLKILPLPAIETTLRFNCDEGEGITRVNEWGGLPLPISATAWLDGNLFVRLSGARAGVAAAAQRMNGQAHEDGAALWFSLRHHTHRFLAQTPTVQKSLWRISVPSTSAPLTLGPTLIEWGGAQRWLWSELDAKEIRSVATRAGGHATRFRSLAQSDVFHPLSTVVEGIHRRLKAEFDPAGIFNPGRMYAGW